MKKGVWYNISKNDPRFIKSAQKHYKIFIRLLSHAKPGLLRLFLIYSAITTILLGLLLFYIWDMYEQVRQQKVVLEANLAYWEDVLEAHSNYPDAYFNAAVYAYRLKEKKKAYEYVERSLMIDPLFEDAKLLRKQILEQ